MVDDGKGKTQNRYQRIAEKIFFDRYQAGRTVLPFLRTDLESAAEELGVALPKNLGDVVYALRYRIEMPKRIRDTQTGEKEWVIQGAGRAKYEFRLVTVNRIKPNPHLLTIKIPDATPEIINAYAFSDEQALLAKVRYNRLIDLFLGLPTFSLQNHLRTTVKGVGQIEIDEIYVGIDKKGRQFVIPVQAKGGNDQLEGSKRGRICYVAGKNFQISFVGRYPPNSS
ncbi:hypothetical protein [Acanthopleuribacter pedis]|uniref:Endonuclease n=1 Tax=Acanthopleuribacter pedis TaxID=442870 RepID=A0A8J7QEJ3_9BACT|nr:hypothetical protein [Acanthopleuribacter pedis]MBO1322474.1 hypothetical protein [Acanthopleuribacter pedis]